MTELPDDLPQDIELCHQLIRLLFNDNRKLGSQMEVLKQRLEEFARARWGRRSETIDPNQLSLFARELIEQYHADTQQELDETSEPAAPSPPPKRRGGGGRTKQPPSVPRERKDHWLSPEELPCPECHAARVIIGHETSEQLVFIPASFKLLVHVQHKYACKSCQGNVQLAPKPAEQVIEKGFPDNSLLANTIARRYAFHLPLYRQEQIYLSEGAEIARSSMCRWLGACARKMDGLFELLKADVLLSRAINADETPLKYLKRGAGKALKGFTWIYRGDSDHPGVIADFQINRKKEHPENFLRDYTGYVQTDAYTGYNGIPATSNAKRLACFAHARRYFEKVRRGDPIADEALARIHILYDIEARIGDLPENKKLEIRQREAVPRLEQFKGWLLSIQPKVLPKSKLGEAVQYCLNNWHMLERYTEQGFLNIDNNSAENALRPIAIGRKNWLFLGNEESGDTFSILASFTLTCQRLGIDVYQYFLDVLNRLCSNQYESLEELLPHRWQKARIAANDSSTAAA